jgi:hypothetical protein
MRIGGVTYESVTWFGLGSPFIYGVCCIAVMSTQHLRKTVLRMVNHIYRFLFVSCHLISPSVYGMDTVEGHPDIGGENFQ